MTLPRLPTTMEKRTPTTRGRTAITTQPTTLPHERAVRLSLRDVIQRTAMNQRTSMKALAESILSSGAAGEGPAEGSSA